jgi:toxin ParE1/3/4
MHARKYLDAIAWYLTHSKSIARTFQLEVHQAIDRIRQGPNQWPAFEGPVRWIRLNRFPYILYFEILTADAVQVLAVAHANRRPGYWRYRQ